MTKAGTISLSILVTLSFLIISSLLYTYIWNITTAVYASLIISLFYLILFREFCKISVSKVDRYKVLFISMLSLLLSSIIAIVSFKNSVNHIPLLAGDAVEYFMASREIIESGKSLSNLRMNYLGYPIVLTSIFRLFGISVLFPFLINTSLLLIVIIRCAVFTYRVTGIRKSFIWTFVLALTTSQFMSYGFMILKDVFIYFAVLLALEGAFRIGEKSIRLKAAIKLLLSVFILAVFRLTFVFVPFLLYFIFNPKSLVKNVLLFLLGGVLITLSIGLGGTAAGNMLDPEVIISWMTSNEVLSSRLGEGDSIITSLLADYESWSIVKKLLALPLTFALQYLTPFNVWDFGLVFTQPWYVLSINLNIFWFLFTGIVFLYTTKRSLSFDSKSRINSIFLIGLLLFILPVFIYGGSIPRYSFAFFPLILPRMSEVIVTSIDQMKFKISFIRFMSVYYLALFGSIVLYLLLKL